jgi:hypothetical protein
MITGNALRCVPRFFMMKMSEDWEDFYKKEKKHERLSKLTEMTEDNRKCTRR